MSIIDSEPSVTRHSPKRVEGAEASPFGNHHAAEANILPPPVRAQRPGGFKTERPLGHPIKCSAARHFLVVRAEAPFPDIAANVEKRVLIGLNAGDRVGPRPLRGLKARDG